MGLEEILKELGADIPFDEKGDLTSNGADAWEKANQCSDRIK